MALCVVVPDKPHPAHAVDVTCLVPAMEQRVMASSDASWACSCSISLMPSHQTGW